MNTVESCIGKIKSQIDQLVNNNTEITTGAWCVVLHRLCVMAVRTPLNYTNVHLTDRSAVIKLVRACTEDAADVIRHDRSKRPKLAVKPEVGDA